MKILPILFLLATSTVFAQTPYLEEMKLYRDSIDAEFSDPEQSILEEADLKVFEGLHYFPVDEKLVITAGVDLIKNGKEFEMATSTERKPIYKAYAKLRFEIDGQKLELTAYQSEQISEDDEYKNYLFLPFNDHTNGGDSYGGGRYLDLDLTKMTETVVLDFNKCYNPYCAYSERFSCPIPPDENKLEVRIEAGVKGFTEH